MLVIRQATLADMGALLQFEQGVIAAERAFDPTLVPGSINYYNLDEFINSPDIEMLVAELDGEPVGGGYARVRTNEKSYLKHSDFAYLGFMYVLPQHRGKGINQLIIERLKQWALSRGLTELRLQVYSDNESAIKAYEKVGFNRHMLEMRIGLE